jgi:outer membrane protein
MKHISTILNVVLLVAVGVLFYLHFAGNKKSTGTVSKSGAATTNTNSASSPKGNIAYIEIDSLHENYTYYKNLKGELERKQKAANNELEEKQRRYQTRMQQLQQKAPTMTQQEQEAAGQELAGLERDIQNRSKELDKDLFDLTNTMKKNVLKKVQDFLAEYNKDKRFDYILSYEPGFMFYKDESLNITGDVVKGLNEMDKKKQD